MKTIVKKILNDVLSYSRHGYAFAIFFLMLTIRQSCTTINPGEVGLRIKRGKLDPQNYTQGKYVNGINNKFIKFSTRIQEVSFNASLPTKEGLDPKNGLDDISCLSRSSSENLLYH